VRGLEGERREWEVKRLFGILFLGMNKNFMGEELVELSEGREAWEKFFFRGLGFWVFFFLGREKWAEEERVEGGRGQIVVSCFC